MTKTQAKGTARRCPDMASALRPAAGAHCCPPAGPRVARRLYAAASELARRWRKPQRWAVVVLHIATPIVDGQMSAQELSEHLHSEARLADARERAIRYLLRNGWTMDPPALRVEDAHSLHQELERHLQDPSSATYSGLPVRPAGHLDLDVRFRKRFTSPREAEAEARELDPQVQDNWSLGWDEQRNGDVAWWKGASDR